LIAEIITIGDEILIGQIVDTNSAWIAQVLNKEGISIKNIQSIADEADAIKSALDLAFTRADLILMTGGLGPTQDDITRQALAEYFNAPLVLNEMAMEHLKSIFAARRRNLLSINEQQAFLPNNCEILFNRQGTAPGMLFKKEGKWLASMPGVPYEMKTIVDEELIPLIRKSFNMGKVYHNTITTINVPESLLAIQLAPILSKLPPYIKPAYLPSLSVVRFRLSAIGETGLKLEVDTLMTEIISFLGKKVVLSESDKSPAECVFELLNNEGKTITMAESCSGGYVAHQLTELAGASAVFKGSLVAYDYDIKTTELGVPEDVLLEKGAVSEETVKYMCEKVRIKFRSDYGIGISGIAGPSGGTEEKPVGTVYIGVSDGIQTIIKRYLFHGDRQRVIERTSNAAYDMIRKLILAIE